MIKKINRAIYVIKEINRLTALINEGHMTQLSQLILTTSNLTKCASRGPIPRLGVTPGGRNLYH